MTDPIDTALEPCPFCGGAAELIVPADGSRPYVMCTANYCSGPKDTAAEAIAAWNTRAASQADTASADGLALGLAMAAAQCDAIAKDADDEDCLQFDQLIAPHMRGAALDILALAPIPPHVAAARVLLDDLRLVPAMVDWADANAFRLSQVQGFGYGGDRLLRTVRDCWLREGQVIWQKQSTPETMNADHDEMMRQMEIYRMSLIIRAALEQIAKEGQ